MKIALVAAFVLLSAPAFAKGKKAVKHHCVGADGAEVAAARTKKACKKAGGKWEKMTASASEADGGTAK